MKRIEDLPEELQNIFQQKWYIFEPIDEQYPEVDDIAERAKFDEQNGLIVKDIGEL